MPKGLKVSHPSIANMIPFVKKKIDYKRKRQCLHDIDVNGSCSSKHWSCFNKQQYVVTSFLSKGGIHRNIGHYFKLDVCVCVFFIVLLKVGLLWVAFFS